MKRLIPVLTTLLLAPLMSLHAQTATPKPTMKLPMSDSRSKARKHDERVCWGFKMQRELRGKIVSRCFSRWIKVAS
jgi:hypothetical protein